MIYRIKELLKRLLHNLGFIVEQVPNDSELFEKIKYAHEAVQHHELRRIAQHIKEGNNQKLYNKILKKKVANWDSNYSSAKFVGHGFGIGNFGIFRKVCLDNKYYFEKVYFNSSNDLLKVQWFYTQVYPIFSKHSLNTPKLHKIIKGDLITIVYFEFIDLIPLSEQELKSVPFYISKQLFNISSTKEMIDIIHNAPQTIKDYKIHYYYKKNIQTAIEIIEDLSERKLSISVIEAVINQQPLILTHADIHNTNMSANNYIIDWDSVGAFPYGFEAAFILYQQTEIVTFSDLQSVLFKEYSEIVDKDQWEDFELSCLYFYFVFIALNTDATVVDLQKSTFSRVKKLYLKKINLTINVE